MGATEQEKARIAAHQPFTSLQDFRDRVRPRRSSFEALVRVGALDAFIGYRESRRHELLAHVRRLSATAVRVAPEQLAFDLELPVPDFGPVTVLDLHGKRQSDLELQSLGLAIRSHQMDRFQDLFRELGVTPASKLIDLPGGTEVLVAGVRRATNTPPMRSGRRTVFVTLDAGTGLTNLVFFPDAQERIKNKVFRTSYMLVRGSTRRSGARGISVTGEMAWDLLHLPQWPTQPAPGQALGKLPIELPVHLPRATGTG
jgi:error-prone DNA polymerase